MSAARLSGSATPWSGRVSGPPKPTSYPAATLRCCYGVLWTSMKWHTLPAKRGIGRVHVRSTPPCPYRSHNSIKVHKAPTDPSAAGGDQPQATFRTSRPSACDQSGDWSSEAQMPQQFLSRDAYGRAISTTGVLMPGWTRDLSARGTLDYPPARSGASAARPHGQQAGGDPAGEQVQDDHRDPRRGRRSGHAGHRTR